MKTPRQVLSRKTLALMCCASVAIVIGFSSIAATAEPPPALSEAVNKYIYEHITDVAYNDPYRFALEDLNGDGRADAIVLMSGSGWCGSGGCTMFIFKRVETGYEFICASTITSTPIRISSKRAHGWRSLIVFSKGKGNVEMRFTRDFRYPGNPSMQPKASQTDVDAARIAIQ